MPVPWVGFRIGNEEVGPGLFTVMLTDIAKLRNGPASAGNVRVAVPTRRRGVSNGNVYVFLQLFQLLLQPEVCWKKLMNIIINCLASHCRLDVYLFVGTRVDVRRVRCKVQGGW